jgi:hypothetical protein
MSSIASAERTAFPRGVRYLRAAVVSALLPFPLLAQAFPEATDSTATPRRLSAAIGPAWVVPLAGPQANPFNDPVPGALLASLGGEATVRTTIGRRPIGLHVGWSRHTHRVGDGGLKLTGNSDWIRGLLMLRVLGDDQRRLRVETGVGLLHSRSTSRLIRAGDEIGLIGATAGIRVVETTPLFSVASIIRLRDRGRFSSSLRLAAEYAPTEGGATFTLPIALQLSR